MDLKSNPFLRALAGLVLALGAGQALAAIANGALHTTPGDASSNSSGELFLNVWDATAAKSYSLDLGTTVEAFLGNPSAIKSWPLDQRFKNFAAAGNPLVYNIAANNTYGTISAAAVGAVPSGYGVLASVLNDPTAIAKAESLTGTAGVNIAQLSSVIQARANTLNLSAAAQNGLNPGDISAMTDFQSNLSEVTDISDSGAGDPYSAYFDTWWGIDLSGQFGFSDAASVRGGTDQNLRLYFFGLQGPGINKTQATDLGQGSLVATLDIANATLSFGAGGSGGGGTGQGCEQLSWAGVIADGGTVTAYSTEQSADCAAAAQLLTCDNGSLPGSDVYPYASCANTYCTLPWDTTQKIADGASVTAYPTNLSADCAAASETRVCHTGQLSGSYTFQTCQAPAACALPWGGTLAHGQSVTAYRVKVDSDCAENAEVRTCNNGKLSGSATYQACSAPTAHADCSLPWGGTLADGQSVTAYSSATSADCAATAETRACTNGVLSGSATYPTCSAPATHADCNLPWGGTLADGQTVTAYSSATSADCAATAETRACANGTLSGSYPYAACTTPTGPYIQLSFPNGGDVLTVGKKQTIAWQFGLTSATRQVHVQFSKNGGAKWKSLKAGVKLGRGFVVWKPLKGQATETGLIRVCAPKTKKAAAVCGTSSGAFAVRR